MYEFSDHNFVIERQGKLDQASESLCGGKGNIYPARAQEVTGAILPTIAKKSPDVRALQVQFFEEDTLEALQRKLVDIKDYLQRQDVLRANIREVYRIIVAQMKIESEQPCSVSKAYGAWLRETLKGYQKIVRKHFPLMVMSEECSTGLADGCFDLSGELVEPLVREEDIGELKAKWSEISKLAFPFGGDDVMLNPEFWKEWRDQIQQAKILRREVFDHLKGVCDELSRYISGELVDFSHVKLVEGVLESLQEYMLMQVTHPVASVRGVLQKAMTKQDYFFQSILREVEAELCRIVDERHAQMSLCRPIAEGLKRQNDHEIVVSRCQDWAFGVAVCCTLPLETSLHAVSFFCCCYACCCYCGEADCISKDRNGRLSPGVLGKDRFPSAQPWDDWCYGPLVVSQCFGRGLGLIFCCDPCAKKEKIDEKLRVLYGNEHRLLEYQTGLASPSPY